MEASECLVGVRIASGYQGLEPDYQGGQRPRWPIPVDGIERVAEAQAMPPRAVQDDTAKTEVVEIQTGVLQGEPE
jgi:hypothetical protein